MQTGLQDPPEPEIWVAVYGGRDRRSGEILVRTANEPLAMMNAWSTKTG